MGRQKREQPKDQTVINLHIDKPLHAELKALSIQNNRSLTGETLSAIKHWLSMHRAQLPQPRSNTSEIWVTPDQ